VLHDFAQRPLTQVNPELQGHRFSQTPPTLFCAQTVSPSMQLAKVTQDLTHTPSHWKPLPHPAFAPQLSHLVVSKPRQSG
jgi:hypothetical protein